LFSEFFRSFGRKLRCKRVVKLLRRLKEAHSQFLDLKKLENIEKAGALVNNCKFAKDSSIPAILLTGKGLIMPRKTIGDRYLH